MKQYIQITKWSFQITANEQFIFQKWYNLGFPKNAVFPTHILMHASKSPYLFLKYKSG